MKIEENAENLVLTSIYFIMIQLPILEAIDNHFGLKLALYVFGIWLSKSIGVSIRLETC